LHIIFSERNTKTRIGAESKNNRPVTPKMFSNDNNYCPMKILKTYISHRPVDINDDPNAKFYLRPLPKPKVRGVMMKEMAGQAELMGRKVNHSTRKKFACTLLQTDRPNTEVAQLWFWKNVATLTHYNAPSFKQQNTTYNLLSETVLPYKSKILDSKESSDIVIQMPQNDENENSDGIDINGNGVSRKYTSGHLENITNYSANY